MKRIASIAIAASVLTSMNALAEGSTKPNAHRADPERDDGIEAIRPVVLEEQPRIAFPGEAEPVFSNLPENSWIDVQYSSEGSFVSGKWTLKFSGGDQPRVKIAGSSNFSNEPPPRELPLSTDDLRGLDRLLSYYRSPPLDIHCTTKEEIVFQLHRNGNSSSEAEIELFADETCGSDRYNDILRFWDLVRRVDE